MSDNYAMDTAARFGEIPFTEFTRDLITGTFEALLDAELQQLKAYTDMVKTLSTDLSTYINNTHDDVSLADLTGFVETLHLPTPSDVTALTTALTSAWGTFQGNATPVTASSTPPPTGTAVTSTALQTILGALPGIAQTVMQLIKPGTGGSVDLHDNSTPANAADIYGQSVPGGTAIPNYNLLYKAIAGKIANDKYSLLQNMVRMGMMRMIVDSGLIETHITFNTWENASNETMDKERHRGVQRVSSGLIGGLLNRRRTRQVTVTTAKAEHRDAHGSSVQIFGRVQINFKTDYLPLASGQ